MIVAALSMASSSNQPEGLADDFFEQILSVPSSYSAGGDDSAASGRNYGLGDANLTGNPSAAMMLQLGSGGGGGSGFGGDGGGGGGFRGLGFPLGLNLQQHQQQVSVDSSSPSPMNEGEPVHLTSMFPAFGQLQPSLPIRPLAPPQLHQPFQSRPSNGTVPSAPNPPSIRPRPRARRGQATDPHSIAERLRRERIAERMRALMELVPTANKTDRAAMLDDIVDYVKFLRLQVKVLSMSRLGGAGAVAQLVSDVSLLSLEGDLGGMEGGSNQQAWTEDGTEQEVAKLMMEEDTGAAMQLLQSKGLCIMPVSLATTIFRARQPDSSGIIKPEPKANS